MNYVIEGDNVYCEDAHIKQHIGVVNKTEIGVRIDDNTVADITSQFDLTLGDYVETGRTTRAEPLPPVPESNEQKIARLEVENATLKQRQAQMDGDFAAFTDQYYIDNPDKA